MDKTIEQKALELVNRIALDRNTRYPCVDRANDSRWEALCRALEARELDKSRHAAELREQAERFSEAAKRIDAMLVELALQQCGMGGDLLRRYNETRGIVRDFILAPADPLAEELTHILEYAGLLNGTEANRKLAAKVLRAAEALDRTLAIVKKEAVNG